MKRMVVACLALLALGAVSLYAADFWQKKKFPEWSEKEALKMLRDSPWAKPIEVRAGGMPMGGGGGGGRGGRGGRGGGGRGGGMADASVGAMGGGPSDSMGGASGGGGGDMGAAPTPAITVTMRCQTALPVKQAIARINLGAEAATSPEAAKMFARQETYYVIGIEGLPRMLLRGDKQDQFLKPEELKDRAFMKVKGKAPVTAEGVKPDVQQGRLNLYVFFPRKDNVVMVEDDNFEIEIKLPTTTLKRSFKLKDMVFDGKLEI